MKGRYKIIFERKPVSDFLSIKIIKTTKSPMLQEIQMPANLSFSHQEIIFGKYNLLHTIIHGVFSISTKLMITSDMS